MARAKILGTLREIDAHRELFGTMVARNIKIRYKRSVLGFLWSLLNPLFLILIYAVFLSLLQANKPGDPLFMPSLVTGIFVWQFLSLCLGDSLQVVLGNAGLVARTSFPRLILPAAMVTANLVNFLLTTVILGVYLVVLKLGGTASIHFHYAGLLPLAIFTQTALCLGLGLILSALNVFFRDTEHLLGMILLAWFFLTPVIYYVSDIPVQYQKLAFLNPMTGIVTLYRTAFLGTDLMAPRLVIMSLAIAWLVFAFGIVFFQKLQSRFVEEF